MQKVRHFNNIGLTTTLRLQQKHIAAVRFDRPQNNRIKNRKSISFKLRIIRVIIFNHIRTCTFL